MTREERENALHCLKVMIDEEVCEECKLYGTTGTDHCEKDCVRLAIEALEQEPCEDCISREKLDKALRNFIRNFPSINPQEPKLDTLDEIRAEIAEEKEHAYADFERYKVEYLGQDEEDVLDSLPQDDFRYGMERCIDIIDKYKAEKGSD